jgi:hypothetical protein
VELAVTRQALFSSDEAGLSDNLDEANMNRPGF